MNIEREVAYLEKVVEGIAKRLHEATEQNDADLIKSLESDLKYYSYALDIYVWNQQQRAN